MSRHGPEVKERVLELLAGGGINEGEILAVVEAGSTAHAISVGSDDLDFTVVRVEPFDELVVGDPKRQSMMLRTKPNGVRSQPGDIDLQVYTFRRFVSLATAGNPSVLMILFAPDELRLIDNGFPGRRIAELTRSSRAAASYQGYMERQLDKWIGGSGKAGGRSELVEAHGYDTKFASHAIRLGLQGIEYLTTGALTLPMSEPVAGRIRDVRRGVICEANALEWARELQEQLDVAALETTLPESPDASAIQESVAGFYADRYGLGR